MLVKKIINTVIVFGAIVTGYTQENNNLPRNRDRILLDLYHSNWFHHDKTLKTKWYSRGIGASYLYEFPIYKKRISFAIGAGVSNYNFYTRSQLGQVVHPDTTLTNATYSQFTPLNEDSLGIKRNKVVLTYGDFPVELRYKSKPNEKGKVFKFAIGARAGYNLDIHTKLVDATGKYKAFNFDNVEKWRFGSHVRFGYDRIAFMAYYNFNTVFKKNLGEPLNPFAIGITYTLLD